jgi:hypothetical protein
MSRVFDIWGLRTRSELAGPPAQIAFWVSASADAAAVGN